MDGSASEEAPDIPARNEYLRDQLNRNPPKLPIDQLSIERNYLDPFDDEEDDFLPVRRPHGFRNPGTPRAYSSEDTRVQPERRL